MIAGIGIDEALRQLLRSRCARGAAAGLEDDLPLGSGGLGLDSIGIAELLLECGERFGIPVPAELLALEPLTVGRLAAHLRYVLG